MINRSDMILYAKNILSANEYTLHFDSVIPFLNYIIGECNWRKRLRGEFGLLNYKFREAVCYFIEGLEYDSMSNEMVYKAFNLLKNCDVFNGTSAAVKV